MKIKSEVLNSNHETNTNFLNLKSKTCGERRRTVSNLKSQILILLFVFCCLLFVVSCRERVVPPDVPPYIYPLTLTDADVSCTEAFIRIKTTKVFESGRLQLKRDGITRIEITDLKTELDTLIVDEGLLPKRAYKYRAYRVVNNISVDSSDELSVLSMDTTSHNFNFEVSYLGEGNNSVLYDVAIINDTLAYAVGEINVKDSLGNWVNPPNNVAKWNGQGWELSTTSDIGYGYGELYCVFAFGPNDIWVGSSIPEHWDGQRWTFHGSTRGYQGGFRIRKIWGTSSRDLYVVGDGGNIRYYNGSSWRRLESGTTTSLLDVWGSPDGSVVWACGWEDFKPTVLLRIKDHKIEKYYEDYDHRGYPRGDTLAGLFVSGMAAVDNIIYILSYTGLYKTSGLIRTWSRRLSFTPNWFPGFPFRVSGKGIDDITIIGEYSMIAHYNGYSWKHYDELMNPDGRLRSVSHKGNLIIAVGWLYDPIHRKGIVYIGGR